MKNFFQTKPLLLISTFISLLLFISCSDDPDDPVIENEQEVMTTFTYTLTPAEGGSAVVLNYRDLDADGPEAVSYTHLRAHET